MATLTHSPARVITLYHNIMAKLIALGHFHTIQLLGLEPSLIVVSFTKEQQAWCGTLTPCAKCISKFYSTTWRMLAFL
jgi:hypothetical protein